MIHALCDDVALKVTVVYAVHSIGSNYMSGAESVIYSSRVREVPDEVHSDRDIGLYVVLNALSLQILKGSGGLIGIYELYALVYGSVLGLIASSVSCSRELEISRIRAFYGNGVSARSYIEHISVKHYDVNSVVHFSRDNNIRGHAVKVYGQYLSRLLGHCCIFYLVNSEPVCACCGLLCRGPVGDLLKSSIEVNEVSVDLLELGSVVSVEIRRYSTGILVDLPVVCHRLVGELLLQLRILDKSAGVEV